MDSALAQLRGGEVWSKKRQERRESKISISSLYQYPSKHTTTCNLSILLSTLIMVS